MQMNAGDVKKFPNFYKYVSTVLPSARNSDAIITTIVELASLVKGDKPFDKEKVIKALNWGEGPMLKIANMLRYGKFAPRRKENTIYIRKKWVKEYEKGGGKRMTKWGEKIDLVEVILLHELTHWVDFHDGKAHEDLEVGNMFEERIYGHIITHRSTRPVE